MAGEVTTDNDLDLGRNPGQSSASGVQDFVQDVMNDPQKRIIAIVIAAVLVIVIAMFFFSGKKPDENRGKLVPLVQEIDQSRAFEIVAKLKSVNIEAKVNPGEKPGQYVVKVYENAVETSYLALSRTNLLEDDDYGLFDQNDWAASDYDKRIKLSRAINGDLSRIISRLDGLRSAIVRVNIPEQQLFSELQADTTATVQVEMLNDGDELSKTQVKSIVNILRGYVPKLNKERISIVDTQGRNYSTFKTDDEAGADDFIDEMDRLNKLMEKRVIKYLDVVLGPGMYEVSVSASLSREKVEQQETIYKEGAVGSRQTGSEVLKANSGADVEGPLVGSGKNYNSQSSSETLLPSFEQKNVTYLPGRITDISVALAVDKSVPAIVSLAQLRESVAAIVGSKTVADKIKITVVDMVSRSSSLDSKATVQSSGMMSVVNNFFQGGAWSVISKIFIVIAIIFALIIVSIISLNFLNSAANKNYTEEIDPNISSEFDEVINDNYNDYGEQDSIAQQEALLREMMGQTASPNNNEANDPKELADSSSRPKKIDEEDLEKVQFENLLNDFQSVAGSKPDILAKKIQVWLDDDQ
jgi:flagellar biosynthesis/type III secretory pathway M-ring protein FliF/YscJ